MQRIFTVEVWRFVAKVETFLHIINSGFEDWAAFNDKTQKSFNKLSSRSCGEVWAFHPCLFPSKKVLNGKEFLNFPAGETGFLSSTF